MAERKIRSGRHFRYVLTVLPFIYIFVSGVFAPATCKRLFFFPVILLFWAIGSSLAIYPHSQSYFNELAGGSANGHRYLLDSSIDWQQDLYLLSEWQKQLPNARPFFVDYYGDNAPELFGIYCNGKPAGYSCHKDDEKKKQPITGWYAISIHELLHYSNNYSFFQSKTPIAIIGYSIYIYHIPESGAEHD